MALAKLTDVALRKAKPSAKDYRLTDGGGLALLVRSNGARLWQYRFRHNGREQIHSLGAYPEITLAAAREEHRKARALVSAGVNPVANRREERREAKQRELVDKAGSFDAVVSAWRELTDPNLAPLSIRQREREVQKYLLPAFKGRSVGSITRVELAALLKKVEARAPEVARNLRNYLTQIFDHAADHGLVDANPVPPRRILSKRASTHHRPLPFDQLHQFISDIQGCTAEPATKAAMLLVVMTACRKNEAAFAVWTEIDLDAALWTIPAHRMKARREHIIPLPRQAVKLLQELRSTAISEAVFPSRSRAGGTMADRTLNALMERTGYAGISVHGFRSLFSTWANENGENPDVIERCLAHVHQNATRRAYNHAQHIAERRDLLQRWADLLLPDGTAQKLAEAA
ncbi:tyrosine-type recombinase/integrase (plasmid) [Atlantibacter subterranea]|uniref:tyrosine-type recombinase/integrase n=1 Tax=Atlantibacter subterraneus TaxID=255519 RepID=UPI0020C2E7BD|nr:integrase arm-type DNA-binding domain-containing protein [Atlantibacter subterranea]UTJ49799.1 tyrosine-type recombinase/integrase [Atlantibacter subterranea]